MLFILLFLYLLIGLYIAFLYNPINKSDITMILLIFLWPTYFFIDQKEDCGC